MLALTPNDEINALASLHMADVFGRSNVYQLPLQPNDTSLQEAVPEYLVGRLLFEPGVTYRELNERFNLGWTPNIIELTDAFDYAAFSETCTDYATPMFVLREGGSLIVLTAAADYTPQTGDNLVTLVAPGHAVDVPKAIIEVEPLTQGLSGELA